MEAEHAVTALGEAFANHQGSQFTSTVFTDVVLSRGIDLSMGGKGN